MEAAADLGLRMGVEGGRETLSVLQQLQASIDRLTGSVDRLEARMARTRGTERMDQGARRATTSLNAMATSVDRTGRSIGVLHRHQDRYISAQARSAAVFGTQIGLLRQLQISLVSVAAALSVRAVVNYADAWQYANNRLRLATNGAAELKRAQTELFAVSQRTFSSFRSSAETFARYERSTRSLGLAQATLTRLTETTQKAVALSGTTTASAEAALYQFGQALATNFRNAGQEMASVMEQTPRLAEAIASGLGLVTEKGAADLGKLRTQFLKGELTTEKVVTALRRSAYSLDADFKKITPTFAQLFTNINQQLGKMVGQSTAMEALRKIIKGISDNFRLVELAVKALTPVLTLLVASSVSTSVGKFGASILSEGLALRERRRALRDYALAQKENAAIDAAAVASQKARTLAMLEGSAASKASALASVQAAETVAAAAAAEKAAVHSAITAQLRLAEARRIAAGRALQMATGMAAATGRNSYVIGANRELADAEKGLKATRRLQAEARAEAKIASTNLIAAQGATARARSEAAVAAREHQAAVGKMAAETAKAEAAAIRARTVLGRTAIAFSALGAAARGALAGLGTMAAGLFSIMGGWPGVILLTVAALVIFRKEIASVLTGIEDANEAWKAFTDGFQKNIADPVRGLGVVLGDTLDGVTKTFAEGIVAVIEGAQRRFLDFIGRSGQFQGDNRPATEQIGGFFANTARDTTKFVNDRIGVTAAAGLIGRQWEGAGRIGARSRELKEFQKNLAETDKMVKDFFIGEIEGLSQLNEKALGLVEAFNALRKADLEGFSENIKALKLPPGIEEQWRKFLTGLVDELNKGGVAFIAFAKFRRMLTETGLAGADAVPEIKELPGMGASFEQQKRQLEEQIALYQRGAQYADGFATALDIVERAAKDSNETLSDKAKYDQATLAMSNYGDEIIRLNFALSDAKSRAQSFLQLVTDRRLVDALDPDKGGSVGLRRVADKIAQTYGRLDSGDLRKGSYKRDLAEAQINVEDRGVIAKASADLAVARDNLTFLNKAVADGEAGLRVYEGALSLAAQSGGALTQEMLDLAKSIEAVNQKGVEMRLEASLNSQREALERLQSSLGSYRQFQEALKTNEFISQGASEEAARALAASAVEMERATERLQKAGENLQRMDIDPFEQFSDDLSSIPADFFDQFRDEGFAAFDDLGDYFKKSFKRLANEIVIQSVLRPIFDPIFKAFSEGINGANPGNGPLANKTRSGGQTAGSILGAAAGTQSPVPGSDVGAMQVRAPNGRIAITANVVNLNAPVANDNTPGAPGSSGGPISPYGSFAPPGDVGGQPQSVLDGWLGKMKAQWGGVTDRFTKMFQGIGDAIGKVSSSLGSLIGKAASTLGKGASGAAAGFAGYSTGTGLASIFNGNQGKTGGQIGGGIGGAAGFAIGGPVGAFIGSTIGGFFGKIFGGLFGRKTATGTINLDTGEVAGKDSKKDSRNERRDIVLESTADAISRLADALGASYAPGFSVQVKAGKKNISTALLDASGNVVASGAKVGAKDVAGAVNEALKLALKQVLEGGDQTLRRLADALMAANVPVESLVNTVSKISSILEFTKEPVSEFRSAIEEMQKTFKDAARASGEYGEAIQQLTAIQLEAFKALAGKFDRDLQRAIMEIEDPVGGQLLDLLKTQRERVLDAEALNKALSDAGDSSGAVGRMNEVFRLNTLELQRFLEELADTPEALAQASSAFEAYRDQLEAMGVESASITAALSAARRQAADAFNRQISKDVLELRSPTMAAFQAMLAQQKELETFAQAVGGNIFATQARNALERQKFFENLSDEEKRELGDFLGLIQDDFGRIGVVLQMLEDQMARYIDRAEEQREATLKAAEAFKSYKDSLDDTILDIQKQYGKGPPQERLQTLQGEFTRLAAAARGGDETAFGRLGGLSQEILSQARSLYAGTAQFATIRDSVLGELTGLSQFAGERSASLFREVDQMDTEIEALREIRNLLADEKSTPILQDILEAGRIQNDITRSLVTELISLRTAQEQAQAITLAQLQQQSFQYLQGQPSSFSGDSDATAERETQQLVARSYQDFSRQQATTNQLISQSNQKLDDLSAEIRRDRNQRALEG